MKGLLIGQLAILVALCAWIARWPPRTTLGLVAQACGSLLALRVLARSGLWLFPPWWAPYAAMLVIALVFGVHLRSTLRHATWPDTWFGWARVLGFAALGAGSSLLLQQLHRATQPTNDPAPFALASPLATGRYLVVNGGGALSVNAHRASMDSSNVRLRPWRGNGHAVDLVAINGLGFRASGLLPRDPARYRIFGLEVLAPCDGTILRMEDGLPDQAPPDYDRAHPAGNHLLIDCGPVHVLLGHLRQGSVRVAIGERVTSGTVVGAVGNSGGTDEPHLHIHAQRPGPPGSPMGGDPVPILLWGRYLVRGDRVAVTAHSLPARQ